MRDGERFLADGWSLTLSDAGAYATPRDIPETAEWIVAPVPGTVASALRDAKRLDAANPTSLENIDAWYQLDLTSEAVGEAVLRFAGLATITEVYFNDELILTSKTMFEAHDVPVVLTGSDRLAMCFRAIGPHLAKTGPRARWRPRMMRSQGLRLIRTTALGFMPGWCPDVVAVGPWRAISLLRTAEKARDFSIIATLEDDGTGILSVSFAASSPAPDLRLLCDGREAAFVFADGYCRAELHLPDIKPWWPQTHGEPALHDVIVSDGSGEHIIGRTGFRRIEADRGHDGNDFALRVNGEKIFCRGAVWTSADIVSLPGGRKDYEPWLKLAAGAVMNMIRIPGIAAYETGEFFQLCDELGIMVWQDLMFANFDYPANDESLLIHVKSEVEQFLNVTSASPSLAILCGGSEMFQQGAMMGLPEAKWRSALATGILAQVCREGRPDAPYVENSPSGGALPFFPNAGVAHYYGVGAYCRPLDDARRANVRFAAECLAFSNVPDTETLDHHLPVPPSHDPGWKARVPRDAGTSWDFEDVREHYLKELYGFEPSRLRYEDPERYLAFSRAATAEVVEATFAEWRRPGSSCNGALVWTLQDLLPGAGWGVIDATGRPKSTWHALKRAFRPVQVVLSDEGTNGLDVHVINDGALPRELVVELACLRDGRQPVVSGNRALTLEPRQAVTLAATDFFGAFFDTTYAYRFGPPSHEVTVARLKDTASGEIIADAFHFPLGRTRALHAAAIEASLVKNEDGGWTLQVQTDRLAQSVSISIEGFRAAETGFHLAPGAAKQLALLPLDDIDASALPSGSISALGSGLVTRF
ncbi:glycoside hydrolase family 2 protein [Neorhizobium sp. JUb45]|uniref:glycosyl hydrolase 2 galactose-binding domain-containing protein n=1 Tax=Neorhizobium sp. JUb45 TaxID=2485113 RepID=UPI001053B8CE|nr:glycoside hydrolase family 2 protein [Neorhizobium sp. JUb45]TCQ99766.1 beta-mannosidase [Neorhizobium sp. JUb45]